MNECLCFPCAEAWTKMKDYAEAAVLMNCSALVNAVAFHPPSCEQGYDLSAAGSCVHGREL